MPADLDAAKYVSFTSYKKDGTPVALPVWVVPFDGGYAFTTDAHAYKVKRIRNDARASLTVCNMKGAIASGATVHEGAAVVLDAADTKRVADLVKAKYKLGWAMLGVYSAVKKVIGKGSSATAECAIKVTLHS
jgi:PPOX class probable F420-dependent enzyme